MEAMSAAPDPAEIAAPSDPALYARKPLLGPMFWVMIACNCPARSSSTRARCPRVGLASHTGECSLLCQASSRTSRSPM